MEMRKRFIAPERMGAWLVTTLGVALAALVMATFGLREARLAGVVSQIEVIKLNDRIKALEAKQVAAPAPAVQAAPVTPEAMPSGN